jgi:hypothetical protein
MRILSNSIVAKRSVLILQGGIGNQLFQINACLNLRPAKIVLIQANPRLLGISFEENLLSELCQIESPSMVEKEFGRMIGKYLIHLNFNPKGLERVPFFKKLILATLRITVSMVYRTSLTFVLDSVEQIPGGKSGVFICGYFQNQFISNELTSRKFVSSDTASSEFQEYRKLALEEAPICIHVRRGDYLMNPEFESLNYEYYRDAMDDLFGRLSTRSIWVFSDSPEIAREVVHSIPGYELRYIERIGKSDLETLELMRYCTGFIVANSTFSVWSALARYDANAPVIAPNAWFSITGLSRDPRFKINMPDQWIKK